MSSAPPAEAAVTYREQAPPLALSPWVRCLWELTVQGDGGPGRVVPDGFMDLVASGPELHLAGPDTRPWQVRRRAGEAASTGARLDAMVAGLTGRLGDAARPDPLVGAAVARLEADPGAVRVGALGPELGLGERQLRRRFLADVGYGPKTLARVLWFQSLLALLRDDRAGRPSLAEAAIRAGYADQAHMTAECTRLAGRSPATLLAGRLNDDRFLQDRRAARGRPWRRPYHREEETT